LEAELLLAGALNWPRIRLYADFDKPVPKEVLAQYREFIRRRAEDREPLQYILGKTEFLGLTLKVNRQALIPRPETEELTSWAIDRLRAVAKEATPPFDAAENLSGANELWACDLCTGGGCVALAVAHYVPTVRLWACDISAEALALAQENAKIIGGAESRVTFLAGDLFASLPQELSGRLTLITANPPYVNPNEALTLAPEVSRHEPKTALFGGTDGLEMIRRICAQAADFLRPGGWLGLEIGATQGAVVQELLATNPEFQFAEIRRDFAGKDRFAVAQKRD
jgi:release factor glutamine methyltransferase